MVGYQEIKIAYALNRAGFIVHVSQVERGLDCGCVCSECGDRLVAKKGALREHHFAHSSDSTCLGAPESLLHRLGKALLLNATQFVLPAHVFKKSHKPKFGGSVSMERVVFPGVRIGVDRVFVEQSLGRFIPDLIMRSGQDELVVEIAVTHSVDRTKLRHIRKAGIPALEVRLTADSLALSPDALSRCLIENTANKKWLFHPDQRTVEADWIKLRRGSRRARWARVASAVQADFATMKNRPVRRTPDKLDWRQYNTWGEQFYRKHRRYPTLEENKSFWAANQKR